MTMGSELLAIQIKMQQRGLYAGQPDGEWGPLTNDGILRAIETIPAVVSISSETHDWPKLPATYAWLRDAGSLPRHLGFALSLLGTLEQAGAGDNPVIMGWRDELRAGGVNVAGYSADSVPWCGLWAAYVMMKADRPVVDKPLWALSWSKWGDDGGQPELGDLLTFTRNGGGHVALYIAEDRDGFYHVLGGNQSDKVSITRIAKARMHACRQPAYATKPASVQPRVVSAAGVVSSNEA